MEDKNACNVISEEQFITLLQSAKYGDHEAILKLIRFFDNDINHVSRFIRLPKEDAQQSIIVEMIELFRRSEL